MQRHKQQTLSVVFVSMMTILTLLLLVVSLAGCSTATQESMLIYERSGGVNGIKEQLHIANDGEALLIRNRRNGQHEHIRFDISDEQLQQLRTLFDDIGFARLRHKYDQPIDTDTLHYTIKYDGHTVRATSETMPDELEPVIEELNRIIRHSMIETPIILARQTRPTTIANTSGHTI